LVSKAKASHSIQMPSNTNKSFENPNSTTIPITESSKDVPKSNIPEIKSNKVMDAPTQRTGTSISRIICVGGAVVDMIGTITSKLIINSSNPGTMSMSYGGVVFNISQNLAKNHNVRHSVELVSAVGLDNHGQALLHYANSIGINTSILETISKEIHEAYTNRTTSKPSALNALYTVFNPSIPISNRLHTATYTAIHGPDGDLHVAVADMNILHQISKHHISNITTKIRTSDIVIVDGNITSDAFAALVGVCQTYMIPVFFEPTSDHKCVLPVQAKSMNKVRKLE